MLGEYIGQFLPLSGGSNFPMTGGLYLNGNGINYDPVASAGSDGSGNFSSNTTTSQFYQTTTDANADSTLAGAAFQVETGWTLSGSHSSTDLQVNRQVNSGSSTGAQYLLDLQLNGASEFHVDVSGNLTMLGNLTASAGTITTTGGIITAKGFRPPSWSVNTTIFVDGTNGNDSTGNGSQTNPYKTATHAVSGAASGSLILLSPGTYTSSSQIVLPNGVSLAGAGVGVTILQPTGTWASGLSALVVPGNGSDISDITIDLTASPTTNRPACVGCNDSVSGNKQFGLNPTMHRVKCINTGSGFAYEASSTSGTSYVYLEDCIWVSNVRCTQWIMTPGNLTVDEFRCQHLFTYSSSVSNSGIGECAFAQGNPSRFFHCLFSMTDTTNTSWSGISYQTIDADGPVELYGSHFITNFPNLPAPSLTTTPGSDPGWWAFSNTGLTKIGAGCTVNPPVSDIGQSLYQALPSPAPHSYALSLVPSGSTVTPWGEAGNALFETATDAGSLTSNTLTIANAATAANAGGVSVALVDGQKMRMRIKNTNATSTAMTLGFGTSYNTAGFSVSTIGAGKRAYLDFTYDGDNSKWDLTGYVTGI